MKKKPLKLLSLCIALTLVSFTVSSAPRDPYARIVQKARTKGGNVIKISPKGGDGYLSLEEGLKSIRPGSVVEFAPGNYQETKYAWIKKIEIPCENVTIQSDGTGRRVDMSLVLLRPGCIVRNIWLYELEADNVTIVDSRLSPLICSSKGKTTSYIFNSLIHHPKLYANRSEVVIKDCTIISMFTPPRMTNAQWRAGGGGNSYKVGHWGGALQFGKFEAKGDVKVINSIIYTNGYIVNTPWDAKALRLEFDNNVVYAGQGAIFNKDGKSTDGSLKTIGEVCRFREGKQKNIMEKTKFRKEPPAYYWHWYWHWRWKRYPGIDMTPVASSTAAKKGIGANIAGSGMPVPKKAN